MLRTLNASLTELDTERTHVSCCGLEKVCGLLISLAETDYYAIWAAVVRLGSQPRQTGHHIGTQLDSSCTSSPGYWSPTRIAA